MQNIKNTEIKDLKLVQEDKANELFDLKEYEKLEKIVAQYATEEKFTEVWLFQMEQNTEASMLFRIFDERLQNIKTEYKDNEKISEMLEDKTNVRRFYQNGTAIIIISDNAVNIENAINQNF